MTNTFTVSIALPGMAGRNVRETSDLTLLQRLGSWLNEQRRYRNTLAELEKMDDRELNDIGISRFDIRRIAREAARGESLQAA